MAAKDIKSYSLEPLNVDGKRDYSDVIQLRSWEGKIPGLSGWVLNAITRVLSRGRQEGPWRE